MSPGRKLSSLRCLYFTLDAGLANPTLTLDAAASREQLEVRCLDQGHFNHGYKGKGKHCSHSLPQPTHNRACPGNRAREKRHAIQEQTYTHSYTAHPIITLINTSWAAKQLLAGMQEHLRPPQGSSLYESVFASVREVELSLQDKMAHHVAFLMKIKPTSNDSDKRLGHQKQLQHTLKLTLQALRA